MMKILLSMLGIAALLSCGKTGELKYSEAVEGGCFLNKGVAAKNSSLPARDTVYYTVTGENLDIFLGFNATCCGDYASDSEISGDSIIIEVSTIQPGLCDCICYYTYNFRFSGIVKGYKYRITVDDFLKFTGEIRL